jgi:dipeptidyl aminopeptidase/acylaminoacyl peptidase
MFLQPIRRFVFTALVANAALFFGATVCFPIAQAQDAKAAPSQKAESEERAHVEDVLHGLSRGRGFGQVAIAPDGKHLAWIERTKDGVEIRVAALLSSANQDLSKVDLTKSERVTAAAKKDEHCREGQLAWSPDAQGLAFFSDCANPEEQTDLYLAQFNGTKLKDKPARRLTELKGYVEDPAFSPDGSKVAFLYVEGATRPAGALAAMKPPAGVIGEDGVEIQRVAVARVNSEKPEAPEELTPANLHVYEFDWSPDSKSLAYIAADPPGENNWWVAKLYTQALIGTPNENSLVLKLDAAQPEVVLAPAEVAGPLHGLQIAVPRWSPDGKRIAFIGGLMSDQGSTGGDVWIVPATGGEPHDLTSQWTDSPAWIEWANDHEIDVSRLNGGDREFLRLNFQISTASQGDDLSGGSSGLFHVSQIIFKIPGTAGDGRLEGSLSAAADHALFVFAASSFDRAPEIYAVRMNQAAAGTGFAGLTQLSHFNDGVEPGWGHSVSLTWKNDEFNVQGWLMLPKDYDPAKKYPLIVEVHGGPAAAVESHWGAGGSLSPAAFSALGYFVLQPNPRGSYGQGEAFVQANRKDFGYGDLRDILAGVDTVLAKYPVDANRVGLTGWSYGGFMSMFAVTQTDRFKAAVAGAGISDWQSYYGENSIDQWMTPYFGASVYDDQGVYAKSSAITYIKQIHTPTLAVVGDRDGECPAPQSYEFWHALRDQHVPTQLVVYPNEGHGFVDPAHRADVMARAVEWFARYMPASQ